MSETFLIKRTAFSDRGDIAAREENSFVIGPGELNGPGGVARDTDLKLYGFGAPKWGEGINQNILRILENNACPAKELNDYNPATGNYDYNPATDPLLPKDEYDLGTGNGITIAFLGQNWFNTTNNLMYTYSGSPLEWSSAGEGGAITGDLVVTGTVTAANPIGVFDLVTLGYANTTYVNTFGDTMSGILNMGSNRIAGVANPIDTGDALNLSYADSRYMQLAVGGALAADLSFTIPSPVAESNGIRWTGNTDLARIYVEGYGGTESSRLVLYMGDNGASQDYISFMSDNGGLVTETLKIKGSAIEPQVNMVFNNKNISGVANFTASVATSGTFWSSNSKFAADTLWLKGSGNTDPVYIKAGTGNAYIQLRTPSSSQNDIAMVSKVGATTSTIGSFTEYAGQKYLNMANNKITAMAEPTLGSDATTKTYVDNAVSAASGAGRILAWVTFNASSGTPIIIAKSANVTSTITDNGVGNFTIHFSPALPTANYAVMGSSTIDSNSRLIVPTFANETSGLFGMSTTSCQVKLYEPYKQVNVDARFASIVFVG